MDDPYISENMLLKLSIILLGPIVALCIWYLFYEVGIPTFSAYISQSYLMFLFTIWPALIWISLYKNGYNYSCLQILFRGISFLIPLLSVCVLCWNAVFLADFLLVLKALKEQPSLDMSWDTKLLWNVDYISILVCSTISPLLLWWGLIYFHTHVSCAGAQGSSF